MKKTGFTLVEILIVVILLGILASIVVPQFTLATVYSKESGLKHDLLVLRNQLELYRVQHGDKYPWEIAGADNDTVVAQLLGRTNEFGEVMDASGDPRDFKCGPYMEKMPTNHFVKDSGGTGDKLEFGSVAPSSSDGTGGGWYVNTVTGKVYAYSNTTDFPDHLKF